VSLASLPDSVLAVFQIGHARTADAASQPFRRTAPTSRWLWYLMSVLCCTSMNLTLRLRKRKRNRSWSRQPWTGIQFGVSACLLSVTTSLQLHHGHMLVVDMCCTLRSLIGDISEDVGCHYRTYELLFLLMAWDFGWGRSRPTRAVMWPSC
jgi:hypothetical protein